MNLPLIHVLDPHAARRDRTLRELAQLGWQARGFGDGATALAACQAAVPQALLVATGLPRLHGVALARRLRGTPRTSRVLLVGCAAGSGLDEARALRAGGFDVVLAGPPTRSALRQALPANTQATEVVEVVEVVERVEIATVAAPRASSTPVQALPSPPQRLRGSFCPHRGAARG